MKSPVLCGPNVLCYVNSVLYGSVTDFSFESSVNTKEMRGVDFPLPFEIAPTMQKVNFSLGLLRLSGDGGAISIGMMAESADISLLKYVTVTIVDRSNGQALFRTDYAVASGEKWDAPSKGLVTGSVSFSCIGYVNEASNAFVV